METFFAKAKEAGIPCFPTNGVAFGCELASTGEIKGIPRGVPQVAAMISAVTDAMDYLVVPKNPGIMISTFNALVGAAAEKAGVKPPVPKPPPPDRKSVV